MQLTLLILICLCCVTISTSKKCYVCNTFKINQNCGDPFNKDTAKYEICDVANHVCLTEKTSSVDGGRIHLFRGCVSSDYCTATVRHLSSFCETCSEDFCNTASVLVPSLLAPLFFIVRYLI